MLDRHTDCVLLRQFVPAQSKCRGAAAEQYERCGLLDRRNDSILLACTAEGGWCKSYVGGITEWKRRRMDVLEAGKDVRNILQLLV